MKREINITIPAGKLTLPIVGRDHIQGPSDAPIALIEYGDYECPHCRRAHPVVASVLQQMGGQVRFAYRHFPLTRVHPHAQPVHQELPMSFVAIDVITSMTSFVSHSE